MVAKIEVQWIESEGVWGANIPEIPISIGKGKTKEEAIRGALVEGFKALCSRVFIAVEPLETFFDLKFEIKELPPFGQAEEKEVLARVQKGLSNQASHKESA